MMRALVAVALVAACGTAHAQEDFEQSVRFTLKPQAAQSLSRSPHVVVKPLHRIDPIGRVVADDSEHDLGMEVQRQAQRFLGTAQILADRNDVRAGLSAISLSGATSSRSRSTLISIQDSFVLNDRLSALVGWRGLKLSNRNANVTIGGNNDRLRARDWFLPHAALRFSDDAGFDIAFGYSETLRTYGDTGQSGPMGLTREGFEKLRLGLRSETHKTIRLGAGWAIDPALRLSLDAYGGRLNNRLTFARDSYMPINGGSAAVHGGSIGVSHIVSPTLRWSVSYSRAHLRTFGSSVANEHDLAVEGAWKTGPWRGSLRAAHGGAPALTGGMAFRRPAIRIEGGVEYAGAEVGGRPLLIGLRVTEPGRFAALAMAQDEMPGGVRAADQARGVMLNANMVW